jgi:hypothetical protein
MLHFYHDLVDAIKVRNASFARRLDRYMCNCYMYRMFTLPVVACMYT